MLFDPAISSRTQALRRSVWFMTGGRVIVTSPEAYCLQPLRVLPLMGETTRPPGLLWARLPGPATVVPRLVTFIAAPTERGLLRERERLSLFLGKEWKIEEMSAPLPAVSALIQGRVEMDQPGEWQGLGVTKSAG